MIIERTLSVCEDCFLSASGSNMEHLDGETSHIDAALNALGPHVHTGDDLGFSWRSCQCCRSTDGGERYELVILAPEPKGQEVTP